MPQYPNQPLPRAAFLFPQSTAHVRQHDESVRYPSLSKRTAAHQPARVRGLEGERNQSLVLHRQTFFQADFLGGSAQKPHGGLLQQAFSSRIYQPENLVRIECKQRHFNLFDHAAQQGSGFNGSNTLLGQEICERIDLKRQLSQRIIRSRTTCSEGIVFFPQSSNHIG